jgi:hypothetical protein
MKTLSQCIFILLVALQPAFAADTPASAASIKELLGVMESRKLVDGMMGQIDANMQASMKQALAGQKLTARQQEIVDQMRAKMVGAFKDEMKWETLEPMMVDIYEKSFSQQEVDGMIKFYKSKPGHAVIVKLPVVMQNTMQMMQQKMASLMPKIIQLQQDAVAQVKAAEETKPAQEK